MLVLSSEEWLQYYRRRNAAGRVVTAQTTPEEEDVFDPSAPGSNRRIVRPEEGGAVEPLVRYYYKIDPRTGQPTIDPQTGKPIMERMLVPLLGGHPYHRNLPEDYSTAEHFVEVQRPQLGKNKQVTKSLQTWMDIFETPEALERFGPSGEGLMYGSGLLPDDLAGSPGDKQWWSHTVQAVSSGDVPRLIHPRLRSERNIPSAEATDFEWDDITEDSKQYNMANRLLARVAANLSLAGQSPDRATALRAAAFVRGVFDPDSVKRPGDQGIMVEDPATGEPNAVLYENRQYNLLWFLEGVLFPDIVSKKIKKMGLPEEAKDMLVTPQITQLIVGKAMNKLLTTYYDSGVTSVDKKTTGKPTRAVSPLGYIWAQIEDELTSHLIQLSREQISQVSLQDSLGGGPSGEGDATREDIIADPRHNPEDALLQKQFNEVAEQESPNRDTKILEFSRLRRQELANTVSKPEYAKLIDRINRGFPRFLMAARVQLPMGESELISKLVQPNPDGSPKFNMAAETPIPSGLCTKCGMVNGPGGVGEAMSRSGDFWNCSNCRAPLGNIPKVDSKGQLIEEPFTETDQQHVNTIGTLNRYVLAYLETEAQKALKRNDPRAAAVIRRMMIGLPVTFEKKQSDRAITPLKGGSNYILGVSGPVGPGRIAVRPLAYMNIRGGGGKKGQEEQRLIADLGLSFGGWGIGELVRGVGYPTSQIGRTVYDRARKTEIGQLAVPPKSELRPYRSHPGDVAEDVARQWSGLSGQEGTFLPETGMTHELLSPPPTVNPADVINVPRSKDQIGKASSSATTSRSAMVREYHMALSNIAMMMMNMQQQGLYDDGQGGVNQERLQKDIMGHSRNVAQTFGGLDHDQVAADVQSMISFIGHAAQGGEITPELIQSYINMPDDDPRKQKVEEAINDEWGKDRTISDSIRQIHEAAEASQQSSFSLGWSVIDGAAKKLKDYIGLLIGGRGKDVGGRAGRPFSFGEGTIRNVADREYGIIEQEGQPKRLQSDIRRFQEDLAFSITGMFGFGGDYDGSVGTLAAPLNGQSPSPVINFDPEITVPDGGHMLSIGDQDVQAFKSGDTWVVDPDQIPEGGFPAGSPVVMGEFIRRLGAPRPGGRNIYYHRGDYFSPAAISERWGIPEDEVRKLSDALLVSGVDSVFSQRAYDPASVSKEVFTALAPTPVMMYFMQRTVDQFRGRRLKETYDLPTTMATNFCKEIGDIVFSGGGEAELQQLAAKYGRRVENPERGTVINEPVPMDLVMRAAAEMIQKWGPSFRTYLVASMYPAQVSALVGPLKVERKVRAEMQQAAEMMMRMAGVAEMVRPRRAVVAARNGGDRWVRVELTG